MPYGLSRPGLALQRRFDPIPAERGVRDAFARAFPEPFGMTDGPWTFPARKRPEGRAPNSESVAGMPGKRSGTGREAARRPFQRRPGSGWRIGWAFLLWLGIPVLVAAQTTNRPPAVTAPPAEGTTSILAIEGHAQVLRTGSPQWDPAYVGETLAAGNLFQTLTNSRAVLLLSGRTQIQVREETRIRIPESRGPERGLMKLFHGFLEYFHRDEPREFPVETGSAYAITLGTEFAIEAAENGPTTVHVIDGKVALTNAAGQLALASGQSGYAAPGFKPVPAPAVKTINLIQWCLYYPGVLNPDELGLEAAERTALAPSLDLYRAGDILGALDAYPAGRQPGSDRETVYYAGLLLAVGRVEAVESLLNGVEAGVSPESNVFHLAQALRTVIAAVRLEGRPPGPVPALTSSFLAESYYEQSQFRLPEARQAARRAKEIAPEFGFAWARLAEMEFSFGEVEAARRAVDRSLELAPRNAEAWAVQGFLLAARNRIHEAVQSFDRALGLNGALGNAWLGRGLCRIRKGELERGRQDLQVAAVVEPGRALFRSYLGKGFSLVGDLSRALHELELAKGLDPKDPTAWLYSALVLKEENRLNEAVRDVESSRELVNNRRVERSRHLLDTDRAVREANLALLYRDAGMADWSAWEAARAVEADYGNYSAHLFLANSFQALRDLRGVESRFETPAINEYLLASLLAPVGAGTLAQSVSQQEYSKLFEADGLGVASSTEYLSYGRWIESLAHYGTFGNSSYALSGYYRTDNGQRPNEDLEQTELSLQWKQQVTDRDDVYLRATYGHAEGGDLLRRYDPRTANRGFDFEESQEPILLGGWHRAWGPGVHTLFLAGWLNDNYDSVNPEQPTLVLGRNAAGAVTDVQPITVRQRYGNELDIYTAEAQQIWENENQGLTVGGRVQTGDFDTHSLHTDATFLFFPIEEERIDSKFDRFSVYGYYRWRPVEPLQLVGGVSYDYLNYPENFRYAPLSGSQDSRDQVSPKGGLVWTPTDQSSFQFGYAQSLGGVSLDPSFRLEPTLVAGINQTFRGLIPESVAGANSGAHFENAGLSWEQKWGRGTYAGVEGEWLWSKADRQVGVYDFVPFTVTPSDTRERLDYQERSVGLSLNQLLGDEWIVGGRYRFSQAELDSRFVEIPDSVLISGNFQPRNDWKSELHRVDLFLIFNHPSGFFGKGESLYFHQSNHGYAPDRPGDDFWQFNLYAGYRFWRRRAEVTVGFLNVADQDYRLNPLNLTPDLPRDRTLMARFRFNF
jgi:tetratricopeptide (TPR) repeat protein